MDHSLNKKINVLMTGAGAPGAAGIIKCLLQDPDINLLICDANPNASGKHIHQNFKQIPKANAPDFISQLKSIAVAEHIQVIMPLVTNELFHFAANKIEFEKYGIKVLVSDYLALQIANNKGRLYTELNKKGIKVPHFHVVNNIAEFEKAVVDLNYPQKDICFKPCVSNGSRGFRIISEQVNEYHLLFNEKPNNTFISLSKIRSILKDNPFPELLVSEYLPGPEYSVDCLCKEGKAIVIVPRIRTKMKEGISVEGEFIENKSIINYCEKIIEVLQLTGNIGIQVKESEEGEFKLLEINPRVQGTIVAGLGAGINLPLLAVKQAMNREINPNELKVKWGTKFVRFFTEAYYH